MTFWIVLGWIALAGSVAGAAVLFILLRFRAGQDALAAARSWEFSPENFASMERLFAEEDLAFLQAQPGYHAAMGARWKRERLQIFRMYLSELKGEFRRLHAQARSLVAHSDAESAGLVGLLMRQELAYVRALTGLEFRLLLMRAGIGKVNAAPLIALLETMRLNLAQRTAQPAI